MPVETYRSKEAYRKARAYTHIRGIKTHAKSVCIKGSGCHEVVHGAKRKGRGKSKSNRKG